MSDVLKDNTNKFNPACPPFWTQSYDMSGCKAAALYPRVRYHNIILEEDPPDKSPQTRTCYTGSPPITTSAPSNGTSACMRSPSSDLNSFSKCSPNNAQTYFGGYQPSSPLNCMTYFGNYQPSSNPPGLLSPNRNFPSVAFRSNNIPGKQRSSSVRLRNDANKVVKSSIENNITFDETLGTSSAQTFSSSLANGGVNAGIDASTPMSSHHKYDQSNVQSSLLGNFPHTTPVHSPQDSLFSSGRSCSNSVGGLDLKLNSKDGQRSKELSSKSKSNCNLSSVVMQPITTFGEDGSEFEYKKYMKLLRSSSFGSIGDIHGMTFSSKPICESPSHFNRGLISAPNAQSNSSHLQSNFHSFSPSFLMRLAQQNENFHDSKFTRNSAPHQMPRGQSFNSNVPFERKKGIRSKNHLLFKTVTDIDIGENRSTVNSNLSKSYYLSNDNDSTPLNNGIVSSNNRNYRRNSIAFGSDFHNIGPSNNDFSLETSPGTQMLNKQKFTNDPLKRQCKLKKNSISFTDRSNSSLSPLPSKDKSSKQPEGNSLSYDRWKIVCNDKGVHLENEKLPATDSFEDKNSQKSEFDEVTRNIHNLVDKDLNDDCNYIPGNGCSFKIPNDAVPGSAIYMNSLKVRRRNSISGSAVPLLPAIDHSSHLDKPSPLTEKFVFGGRRNKIVNHLDSSLPSVHNSNTSKKSYKSALYSGHAQDSLESKVENIIKKCNNKIIEQEMKSPLAIDTKSEKENLPIRISNNSDFDFMNDYNIQDIINDNRERLQTDSSYHHHTPTRQRLEPLSISDLNLPGHDSINSDDDSKEYSNENDCNLSGNYDNVNDDDTSNLRLDNDVVTSETNTKDQSFAEMEKRVAEGCASLKDSARNRINHSFGLKNYQSSKGSDQIRNVDGSCEGGGAKQFPTRKIARRMTTAGLVKPVLQKFVNLSAQKLLRKPEHIRMSSDTEKLIENKQNSYMKNSDNCQNISNEYGNSGLTKLEKRNLSVYPEDGKSNSSDSSSVCFDNNDHSTITVSNGMTGGHPLMPSSSPLIRPPRRNKTNRRSKKKTKLSSQSCSTASPLSSPAFNELKCVEMDVSSSAVDDVQAEASSFEENHRCLDEITVNKDFETNKKSEYDKNGGLVKRKISKVKDKIKKSTITNSISPFSTNKETVQGGDESEQGLISIRITPHTAGKFAGKFGFNVKGGADQDTPVLVSKVTAGSPADTCYPRLNEGDQVLLINGRDVSSMTHEQVVNSIKASRESHSGELVLTVRQNVYEGEGSDEPPFRFVPETSSTSTALKTGGVISPPSTDASSSTATTPHQLKESMLLLKSGLESGDLISRFEVLYRRKPGLTMDVARHPRNENRNRYRDISPYDATRVTLAPLSPSSEHNDYINASHVVMEVPGSNITNTYIACQGPLSSTSLHFWQMVWEQNSSLLVMLTTVIEQGRSKCHQYWPERGITAEYGCFKVSCNSYSVTSGFATREFTLTNKQTGDNRELLHLQYLAWPDHGVPEHSTDFLTFVKRVREIRRECSESGATIVHCSAGIGRTGVLILMETAQCLIEANQPIYPLELVEQMRNQRAMMIQTPGQFRFVCEAISRVYSEKQVQPLPQYCSSSR